MSEPSAWASMAERGSIRALALLRGWYRLFGRRMSVALLVPIVTYFYLTGRREKLASRDFLQTLHATPEGRARLGGPPRGRHVFRHLFSFAENLLDRMILWGGDGHRMTIHNQGREWLDELARSGRGAILLSSHLGSFDMLRELSDQTGIVLNVLMFSRHVQMITSFFERLQVGRKLRLIHVDPGSLDAAFQIRAAIARGEFVGILGDRSWYSDRHRTVSIPFLGRRARFPLDPYLLQGALGCPMLMTTCVRVAPATYRARTLPFAPAGVVPRVDRLKHAEELAHRFAAELERGCLETPFQWFNFFAFWKSAESE
ncbi:MAG TPA: hypothetical protein VMR50_17165 [Myxococcota bacterium]|nr:hypothetical protein [Myxococcota bacterium]